MSHARQRAASCRPVLASSLFALLCTGSRVKAFSTQPQSKSPFCFSTSLFKWTSLAMGRKSNELLFPSTSLPTLQPWIFLVIRNRFDVHIAPLWHYFWRHQQFRILLQHPGTNSRFWASTLVKGIDFRYTYTCFEGGEPEHLEETHTNTGRTCKLHTERPWPSWESNPGHSCFEATVLTTNPLCSQLL